MRGIKSDSIESKMGVLNPYVCLSLKNVLWFNDQVAKNKTQNKTRAHGNRLDKL